MIGGKAPNVYLNSIEQNHQMPGDRLDEILRSHQIEPALLRADAFEEFIRDRAGKLLDLIEQAMGKAVSGATRMRSFASLAGRCRQAAAPSRARFG